MKMKRIALAALMIMAGAVAVPDAPVSGFYFKYGSTGLCPVGGGLFYFAEPGKNAETGRQYSRTHLYRWTGAPAEPFERL